MLVGLTVSDQDHRLQILSFVAVLAPDWHEDCWLPTVSRKKKQGHGQTHVLCIPLFTAQGRNFFFVLHLRICNMSIYVGIWKIGLTIVYCKVGARSRFKLCPLARQIFILKGEKLLLHNFRIMIPKFPSILFICIYLANLQSKSKLKTFLVLTL